MMDNLFPDTKEKQSLELLEAITRRDFDLECFADRMEASYLLSAPMDLKPAILKRAASPEVQLEIRTKELSKKAQLFLYSLKIGTAVAGAILLLSIAPALSRNGISSFETGYEIRYRTPDRPLREKMRQISDYINQVSNEIIPNGGTIK